MPRQHPETPEEKSERVKAMRKSHRSMHEQQLEMLRLIQRNGGRTIEELAEDLNVSDRAIKNYRSGLKNGEFILDTYIQIGDEDFERGGCMPTSAHPIVLVANSSEVYTLLTALMEFSGRNCHTDMGDIATWLAGEIHSQLTDHCRGCVDPALEADGLKVPEDRVPKFHREDGNNVDDASPYYRTMLQKQEARVAVRYTTENGEEAGPFVGRVRRCREAPGMLTLETEGGRVNIPRDKVASIIKLRDDLR